MQKGISVQMPVANSAILEQEADKEDAKIVTVTESGDIYFGADPISLTELPDKVKKTPFRRGQKLYIKADSRTLYAQVLNVLEATRTGGIAPQVLLTASFESAPSGSMASPAGLEVLLDQPSGSQPTEVQVTRSDAGAPLVKVNNRQIRWDNLQNMLTQIFQNRPERVVLVQADNQLPFANVVRVIDACAATGARVVVTP
jgi:biopolymer transport protein ExbD